mmetsp:Transcript_115022/g.330439  ORF Transcript_115022/g.330439 Transcript_115022/m.330439 type:complete len:233 (-) Transcript_115022:170-868(-)
MIPTLRWQLRAVIRLQHRWDRGLTIPWHRIGMSSNPAIVAHNLHGLGAAAIADLPRLNPPCQGLEHSNRKRGRTAASPRIRRPSLHTLRPLSWGHTSRRAPAPDSPMLRNVLRKCPWPCVRWLLLNCGCPPTFGRVRGLPMLGRTLDPHPQPARPMLLHLHNCSARGRARRLGAWYCTHALVRHLCHHRFALLLWKRSLCLDSALHHLQRRCRNQTRQNPSVARSPEQQRSR